MGRYKTNALNTEQFEKIIQCLVDGIHTDKVILKPNQETAFALTLQGNLGLRIGDIVNLKLNDFVFDGWRYTLDIIEEKTNKSRKQFTVNKFIYEYALNYCLDNGIRRNNKMITIGVRAIQKNLKKVAEYLGYKNISTHSFRKYFATSIYMENNYNIILVQKLLQHTKADTTQAYIGISEKQIEDALDKHVILPSLQKSN